MSEEVHFPYPPPASMSALNCRSLQTCLCSMIHHRCHCHCCSFHGVFLDPITSRWSLVSWDELLQCGLNRYVRTETASSFCAMQSVSWCVWFNFISLPLTELLVFVRLSFRCDMDNAYKHTRKKVVQLDIHILLILPCPTEMSPITAYCTLTNFCETWGLLHCKSLFQPEFCMLTKEIP